MYNSCLDLLEMVHKMMDTGCRLILSSWSDEDMIYFLQGEDFCWIYRKLVPSSQFLKNCSLMIIGGNASIFAPVPTF